MTGIKTKDLWGFDYIVEAKGIKANDLKKMIADEIITAFVKAPYNDMNTWFELHADAAKGSYGTEIETLLLLTREADDSIGNWEREINWSLIHLRATDIEKHLKLVRIPVLKLLSEDFTHFIFDSKEYEIPRHKAEVLNVLYKAYSSPTPAMAQKLILNEATKNLEAFDASLSDKLPGDKLTDYFRVSDPRKPQIIDEVILKVAPGKFRFANHILEK